MASTQIKKVVIPVAGIGTRGLPFTKEIPKEMLPIVDTPAIHFIVEEVLQAGIEQVVFVTSKGKSALEDYFDASPGLVNFLRSRGKDGLAEKVEQIGSLCEVMSVRQKAPLGLGHAVYCARSVVGDEPFAVCLGDELFPNWHAENQAALPLKRLVESAEKRGHSVIGVMEVPKETVHRYGVVDVGGASLEAESVAVTKTVEKPSADKAPSSYAVIGRYVFDSEIFDCLADLKPVSHEIQLTDAMDQLSAKGRLHALKLTGRRYDVGHALSYLQAQIDYGLLNPEWGKQLGAYVKQI